MPKTRWPTRVVISCSTRSGSRASVKQAAKRRTSPMDRSVAPSSRAPASEVIAPPSKPATTARPSTGAKSNSAGLHSVCIGGLLCIAARLCRRRTFAGSEPRCTYAREKSGLAEQDSPSGDERIAQEVCEVAVVGVLRHGPPDRHHERDRGLDLLLRPLLGGVE